MARNERYVTTIELNTQQATDHLEKLKKKVADLEKEREKVKALGGFFDEKELTKARKQVSELEYQIKGADNAIVNIADVSSSYLSKALRKLKADAKDMLPGTQEWKEKQSAIEEIERRIKELRNTTKEARAETEGLNANIENLSKVVTNLKDASLNQLTQAQSFLEQELAKGNLEPVMKNIHTDQLKEIKARIQEIKEEQRKVNTLMDQYGREIAESEKLMRDVEEQNKLIENTLNNISRSSVRDLEYSIKMLNQQMRGMDRGEAYEEMEKKVKKLRTELEKTRFEGKASQGLLNRTTDFFNKLQGTWIVGVAGFNKLRESVLKSTEAFAKMDQEMQNVRKYTGQTIEKIHEMNEEFKKMDTRTSREKLNQLAGDAGRLGITSQEAVLDFVDAADKINVALGDDLGENAVKNIGKLAMSFGTDKTMGLRGAMLATGSAVNELAQNSSASAGYLVDFTARVAGFGRQVGLTQSQIMGFGAVMDENMLRDEMAATAFGQLLVKMTTDLDTFARLTGMKVEEYKKLVTEDINGAILAVARSLKGRDMQDLGKVFDAMNLDGQRAIGVLSTLGDKVEDVAERQRIATEAFEKGTSVIEEFNIQNNTVQAKLDKAKKAFHDITIELGEKLMPIAHSGVNLFSLFVKGLNFLIDVVVKYRSTLITLTVAIVAWNAATIASITWNKALKPVIDGVSLAVKNLIKLSSQNPWGVFITATVTVIALLKDFSRVADGTRRAVSDLKKIQDENTASMKVEKLEVDNLVKVINSQTVSENEKRVALEKLNQKMQDYHLPNLTEEAVRTGKATQQLSLYNKQFELRLRLEAMQVKYQESLKRQSEAESYVNEHKIDKSDPLNKTIIGDHKGSDYLWNQNRERIEQEKKYQEQLLGDIRKAQESSSFSNWLDEQMEKQRQLLEGTKDSKNKEEFTDPKEEEKKRKAAEAAAKKEDTRKKKELKDRNDAIKAQTEQELAIVMNRYAKGEIDYRNYISEIDRIQLDGFNKRLAIYDEESDEYKKIQNDRETYFLKSVERQERMNQREVELVHQSVMAELQSKQWDDEGEYLEAMYQEDINYLQNKAALYRKGSEERVEIEEEITEREYQHQLERQQRYAEMVEELKENYLNMGNERLQAVALNGLGELHRQGLIKEEEYQRAKIAIQAQYASTASPDEQAKQTGSQMLTNAQNNVNKNAQAEGTSYGTPIVGSIKQYQATMEQLKVLYANDKENHAAYLSAKQQATAEFCSQLASEFQAAYSSVNQIMSAASSYYSAQADYETAVVKKKYEKQIAAAGNNQKKVKKLQEKQAKEEAAIKSKYNARQVKIQIAQAIAQTAMNAINAYGAVAGIPIVGPALAVVAAAAAVAAGMVQIASIKKQAQAQEAGYYSGGFTGGRRYRKEAGVVHEGEFVANHHAVNNPSVRPMLELIDKAQRENKVGSLTADDISRQLGNGGSAVVVPTVNVSNDNSDLRESLDRNSDVNEELLFTLREKGINVDFPMDKFDREYNHFKKLSDR